MARNNSARVSRADLLDIELRSAHARSPGSMSTAGPADRRNVEARRTLSRRIQGEFEEMPGLSLTLNQASRLFGVSVDVAARIFRELASEGVLRQTADGRYVLDHDHP